MEKLKKCNLCPHTCNVDRMSGKVGRCKVKDKVKVALVSVHNFEEPPISGTKGSGTIFFSGCNLNCVYCQNHDISSGGFGKEISIERLAKIMLEQEQRGVHNINLVTPTIYVEHIKEAIKIAKGKGLSIPIVYNSSGYESLETLKSLEGYIDIYLPDFKYYFDELGEEYSKVKNYSKYAKAALIEMRRQVEDNIDKEGIMKTGLIVRHLILPGNIENSKKVITWIRDNLGKDTIISVMAQYFPTYKAKEHPKLNRKITKQELEEIKEYIYDLDMTGYIQELSDYEEEYVPEFNLDNV